MYTPKSDFLNILIERGLFNQASDLEGLDKNFALVLLLDIGEPTQQQTAFMLEILLLLLY